MHQYQTLGTAICKTLRVDVAEMETDPSIFCESELPNLVARYGPVNNTFGQYFKYSSMIFAAERHLG